MRRTDRLYELIQLLRDGRLHRAQDLAARLGVSMRTIYRDMETLAASGVPVEGARGVGYQVSAAITLPPLNLTMTEVEALHLGMRIVGEVADSDLQAAARSLSAKIDAVLPEDRKAPPTGWGFATYPFADAARGFQHMPTLRAAIRVRQKLRIAYENEACEAGGAEIGERTIRPLQLEYWGRLWTVTCWCELRSDFQVLRVDRIKEMRLLPELFVEEPGKSLRDFMARENARPEG